MASQPNEPIPAVIAEQMALDREHRRTERQALATVPVSDMAALPTRTSFMPQSMGEAMQLATIMARSTFVPTHCRGAEGNCLAIIMQAGRWGMDPFAVANKAYFVKDGAPPAFESQLVNAVVNSSGALSGRLRVAFEGEGEALRCTVRGFLRADPSDEKVKTQSIARITTRNSPLWKSDPEQQLAYYTTRGWARLHCPEVLLGVYTPDEMEVDPERARVVSMPRRSDHDDSEDEGETELVNEITGEVIQTDARGMTVVSQAEAEALDAQQGGQVVDGAVLNDATFVGEIQPRSAERGDTWWNPNNNTTRYAHETRHGIKWYLEPQEEEAAAQPSKVVVEQPGDPVRNNDPVAIATAGCRNAKTKRDIDAVDQAWLRARNDITDGELVSRIDSMIYATKREISAAAQQA